MTFVSASTLFPPRVDHKHAAAHQPKRRSQVAKQAAIQHAKDVRMKSPKHQKDTAAGGGSNRSEGRAAQRLARGPRSTAPVARARQRCARNHQHPYRPHQACLSCRCLCMLCMQAQTVRVFVPRSSSGVWACHGAVHGADDSTGKSMGCADWRTAPAAARSGYSRRISAADAGWCSTVCMLHTPTCAVCSLAVWATCCSKLCVVRHLATATLCPTQAQ